MKRFGKTIREHIEKKGYTLYNFAKQYGIERTLLQKYISEDRKPKDVQEVISIAEFLELSSEETIDLLEKYNILKYGCKRYKSFKSIERIINNKKPDREMNGHYETFINKIYELIVREFSDGNNRIIRVACQPDETIIWYLLELLYNSRDNDIQLEQIMCFGYGQGGDVDNVTNLYNIIQYAEKCNRYAGYCYYEEERLLNNNMELFPVTMILPEVVIRCDESAQQVVVHRNKEIVDLFIEQYEKIKLQSTLAIVTDYTYSKGMDEDNLRLEKDKILIFDGKTGDKCISVKERSILNAFEEYRKIQGL